MSLPEFDTVEWQRARDAKLQEWLQDPWAIQFIVQFGDICELFDDLIDKDKPIRDEHVQRVLWACLTELPLNPWFDKWKTQLIPVIVTGINAWLDANELEQGSADEQVFSYVLRDWYMELLAYCIYICRGKNYLRSVSMEIRRFFTKHETLDDYRRKLAESRLGVPHEHGW